MTSRTWLIVPLLLLGSRVTALADPPPTPVASSEPSKQPPAEPTEAPAPAPAPPPVHHDAAETANAPLPGDESGLTAGKDGGDSIPRIAARDLLAVPKYVLEGALLPATGAMYAYDKYQLEGLYYKLFYNKALTFGVVPTAQYQTGIGALVGAQAVDTDLAGDHEHGSFAAQYGGAYHESFSGWVNTGDRFAPVKIGIGANFDRRPGDAFYGIGNGELGGEPPSPIDPRSNTSGYLTYYRYQEERVATQVDVHAVSALHVIGRGSVASLQFGQSDTGVPIGDVYNTNDLVGFNGGVEHADGELELKWDTRGLGDTWESSNPGAGSLASVRAARVHRLDGGDDFWHYGVELQHLIHIAEGPRVLMLRFMGEGVSGTRDEVPFSELPYLGGDILRGYVFERFRDRVAGLVSAEYLWDVSRYLDAYLFVDAGRVFPGLDELTIDQPRVGYGLGFILRGTSDFLVEGSIASTIDGGLILTASFNPVFNQRTRWR